MTTSAAHERSDTETPSRRIAGFQQWRDLLFIHWRVPREQLQPVLPPLLTVEEFDGSGWLGLVPFSMQGIRPWWSPSVPGISWFLETNVRTYVRHENGDSGVWFFSLDANSRVAVSVARRFWHLNYVLSAMTLRKSGNVLEYSGRRVQAPDSGYEIQCGPDLSRSLTTATPDSLDQFLLERYLLFCRRRDGMFYTGQVHHEPYKFRPVNNLSCRQTLTDAAGIAIDSEHFPEHVAFSPGVDVRVSPLTRI